MEGEFDLARKELERVRKEHSSRIDDLERLQGDNQSNKQKEFEEEVEVLER